MYLEIPRVLLALEVGLEGAIRRRVDAEVQRGPLGRSVGLGREVRLDGDQMVAHRPVVAILGPVVFRRSLSHDPGTVHVIVVDDAKNHGSDSGRLVISVDEQLALSFEHGRLVFVFIVLIIRIKVEIVLKRIGARATNNAHSELCKTKFDSTFA